MDTIIKQYLVLMIGGFIIGAVLSHYFGLNVMEKPWTFFAVDLPLVAILIFLVNKFIR